MIGATSRSNVSSDELLTEESPGERVPHPSYAFCAKEGGFFDFPPADNWGSKRMVPLISKLHPSRRSRSVIPRLRCSIQLP